MERRGTGRGNPSTRVTADSYGQGARSLLTWTFVMIRESCVSLFYACAAVKQQDKRHTPEILCLSTGSILSVLWRYMTAKQRKADFTTHHYKCLLSLPRSQKGGEGEDFKFRLFCPSESLKDQCFLLFIFSPRKLLILLLVILKTFLIFSTNQYRTCSYF